MRKTLASFGLFLFLAVGLRAEIQHVEKFGGLSTDDSPLTLEDKTPDSENVITDVGPGLTGRLGFTSFSTTTCNQGMWEFPHSNGTRYIICGDTGTLKASQGGGTFNIRISTVATSSKLVLTQLGDTIYWSNLTDGLHSWDTSTAASIDGTLTFTNLVTHKGRIWGAGVPSAPRTVYASAFNNASNFTLATDPVVTDPAQFVIGGALDEPILDLYASFQDKLIWMKAHSFGAIYGNDRSDFAVRVISDRVGTAYPDSIRDCDGYLRWLAGARTIFEFDGAVYYPISRKNKFSQASIDGLLATVVQGDANSRSFAVTSQTDFGAGTFGVDLSSVSSPGDVQFSTTGVTIDKFEDGDYTSSPVWTLSTTLSNAVESIGGTYVFRSTSTGINRQFMLYTTSVQASSGSWSVDFKSNDTGTNFFEVGICTGTPVGPSSRSGCYYISVSPALTWSLTVNSSVLTSGSTPANAFDGTFRTLRIDRSTAGVFTAWLDSSLLGSTTDTTYSSFAYLSLAQVFGANGTYSHLDNVAYKAFNSTYTYTGIAVGTSISAWGTFTAETTNNGGTHRLVLYGDSNATFTPTNAATFTSSQTISSAQIPSIATAPYVHVLDNFNRNVSTQTPTLGGFSVSWNEGSTLRVASGYINQRYWLGVAISSTSNNRVLVYDRNRDWQRYSGINMDITTPYNGSLLFSNSAGTFQAESGYTDNGSAITSYYRTQTYSPATPHLGSTFNNLYLTMDNSASSIASSYQVNGINTDYSLATYAMNTTSGVNDIRLPFSFSQIQRAKNINFLWTVSSTVFWRLLGASFDFVPDKVSP